MSLQVLSTIAFASLRAFKPIAMGYARDLAAPSAPSWEGLSSLELMVLIEAPSILAAPLIGSPRPMLDF